MTYPSCVGRGAEIDEWVSGHKTNKDFGLAQIYLTPEEFAWLELRALCHQKNNRVLLTAGHGPVKNFVRYMQTAWVEMSMSGRPTFTDIRTAVSGHAKNHHDDHVRHKIAKFMCHSTNTADKFYALALDNVKAREMREQFQAVIASSSSTTTTPAPTSASKSSSPKTKAKRVEPEESEDETEDIYFQESGSSNSEEEMADQEGEDFTNPVERANSREESAGCETAHSHDQAEPIADVCKSFPADRGPGNG
ncbi:uncharacterized protein [Cebidichthys violaceus]|uniref:uncharacterized protein n=1 Tax=Cebidichthys violaceus TaxID=271503 RepID=UPI0035CC4AB9